MIYLLIGAVAIAVFAAIAVILVGLYALARAVLHVAWLPVLLLRDRAERVARAEARDRWASAFRRYW